MTTEREPIPEQLVEVLRGMSADAVDYAAERERVRARLAFVVPALRPVVLDPRAPSGSTHAAPSSGAASVRSAAGAAKGVAIGWLGPVFVAGALAGFAADRIATRDAPRSPVVVATVVARKQDPSPTPLHEPPAAPANVVPPRPLPATPP